MAKKTINFDPEGDSLTVELACGHAQDGVYNLYIWEADTNEIVWETFGDFESSADDRYTIPGETRDHKGRKFHASLRVILIPPIKQYDVTLRIFQGGRELGTVIESGESDFPTLPLDLVARLEALEE